MRIFVCFLTLLFIICAHSATAQSIPGLTQDQQSQADNEIGKEQLNDLIGTLEDEEKRQDFLDKLKAMSEIQEEDNTEEKALLDLSQTTGSFVNAYENFVADLGISEGLFAQITSSIGIIVVWFIFIMIVRKLAHLLRDRLNTLREKHDLSHNRFRLYARYIRYGGYLVVTSIALYTLSVVWDFSEGDLTLNGTGQLILVNMLNILVVTFIAIIVWESVNTAIESYIKKLDSSHSSRMLTLIPIIRNVFFVAFTILFMLVLLSEIGVNVVPLLAGAGVLGIAIGLGAQTMIKDFLTGFTIILEDLVQVGDVASVGGKTGVIERITIRKIQLRDLSGVVYTVPFSEISIVENLTKDFSYYVMDIGVAYRENTDEVIEYLKEIDQEMRGEEEYGDMIMEPLEIMGVDKLASSAVIIKARIKTRPIKQWTVGREFNRRMKFKFDAMNIEIPFPHQTLYFGEDKKGNAPAAPIKIIDQKNRQKAKSKKKAMKDK